MFQVVETFWLIRRMFQMLGILRLVWFIQTFQIVPRCVVCHAIASGDQAILGCANCSKKRKYCSKECQKFEYALCHKEYCGKSGEFMFDYDVRVSQGKGLGLFAKRGFSQGDVVLTEVAQVAFHRSHEWRFAANKPSPILDAVAQLSVTTVTHVIGITLAIGGVRDHNSNTCYTSPLDSRRNRADGPLDLDGADEPCNAMAH